MRAGLETRENAQAEISRDWRASYKDCIDRKGVRIRGVPIHYVATGEDRWRRDHGYHAGRSGPSFAPLKPFTHPVHTNQESMMAKTSKTTKKPMRKATSKLPAALKAMENIVVDTGGS